MKKKIFQAIENPHGEFLVLVHGPAHTESLPNPCSSLEEANRLVTQLQETVDAERWDELDTLLYEAGCNEFDCMPDLIRNAID